MDELNSNVFSQLDELLKSTDLTNVTADGAGFEDLKDGYYLCELEKAELKTSKSSGQPMVAIQFKVVEDGVDINTSTGELVPIKGSKNRKMFKNYVLTNATSMERFVSDMLKFEGEVAGEPLLEKEAFTSSELLESALDILVGRNIYVQVSTSKKNDGSTSTWQNPISWKRVAALKLPQ